MKEPTQTRGRDLLAAELIQRGRTQKWVADQLGLNQSAVSLWVSGHARPDSDHRTALRVLLGIPEESWRLPDEQAVIDRVTSAAPTSNEAA